jgi:formate hydrogenlyase transcriptional activator
MTAMDEPTRRDSAADAAQRYRTLLEVNNAIVSKLTERELLHATCEALKRVVPFDRAALTLYVPERDSLRILALEGHFYSDHFVVGLELDRTDSHAGWAFSQQRPLVRAYLAVEAQYSPEKRLNAEGIESLCTVPLILRGKSIGTLNVASKSPGQYSVADGQFLQEVANQVALAVANMVAYEEIAALKARLERENIYLRDEIRKEHNFEEIIGNSPVLLEVLRHVESVAPTDTTVLIQGETGTGKELIARAIHSRSPRSGRPMVTVNCGAISPGLVESELFGHVKGAFTGALERKVGRFEFADGGSLFLDEVSELPPETQVKLLRVLQEQEFEPVGSSRTQRVDVRIIAATNRDLAERVREGRFRADLLYRLNVLPIRIPPLRERPADIPQLAMFFLERYARRFGRPARDISRDTMQRLVAYAWPGNIRELQNVIERGVVLTHVRILALDDNLLPVAHQPLAASSPAIVADAADAETRGFPEALPGLTMEEVERRHIRAVLEQTGGVIEGPQGAARILALHPNTLRSRMKKLGIKRTAHDIS